LDALASGRPRNTSNSSYGHSIVDVNSTARWGGYSPAAFLPSPKGSFRSGSWSHPSLKRHASGSRSSRLDMVTSADMGEDYFTQDAPPVRSPVPQLSSPRPRSHHSGNIAEEQEVEFREHRESEPHYDKRLSAGSHNPSHNHDTTREHQRGIPDRPSTAASGDTYQQARTLFHDFDGVHIEEQYDEEGRRLSYAENRLSSESTSHVAGIQRYSIPPPNDGMVFYPAPVPRMLNLPKRLSQLPSATVQAKRRTQALAQLAPEARKSALWLSGDKDHSSEEISLDNEQTPKRKTMELRRNTKSMMNIPPQLRASMFFDQQASSQEVEVKGESAEATLDSILEASARAPVSAFTDHPFAGHIGNEVYGQDKSHHARRSTVSTLDPTKINADAHKSRSSLNLGGIFGRRSSSGDDIMKPHARNNSKLTLATGVGSNGEPIAEEDQSHHSDDGKSHTGSHSEDEQQQEDEDVQPEPQAFGPPTTLLAELQMRKQQQRTRNRTAATAFPNGMHATLLELDAVAQIEKERRKGQRVALAWEDPALKEAQDAAEQDDEDVPLGMLFPAKNGLAAKAGQTGRVGQTDWDRPLGLMEKREIEDNEPLSRRRNRILGIDPNLTRRTPGGQLNPHLAAPAPSITDAAVPQQPNHMEQNEDEEDQGETLAQRIQRLKTKSVLDQTIEEVKTRPVSGDFAAEMMSQLGVKEEDNQNEPKENTAGHNDIADLEEETLGQRRARLQREALARGNAQKTLVGTESQQPSANTLSPPPPANPLGLRQSHSMADLLAAHPAGAANNARKVSDEALMDSLPLGSLLQQSVVKTARQKRELLETNKGGRVGTAGGPLVDVDKKDKDWDTPLGLLGSVGGKQGVNQHLVMGPPNHLQQQQQQIPIQPMGMNGIGMQMPMSMPMGMNMNMGMPMGMVGMNGMPTNGMPMVMNNMNMGVGMMGMPSMGMTGMNNMGMIGAMGMNGLHMPMMAQASEQPMDPRQRDLIDRWRQSIMP
jgi:hypothetical protein